MIDVLIKKLPDDVVMYQLKKNYHIFRLNNRRIRALFVNIFLKDKRVTQVKTIVIHVTLVPNTSQML